MNTSAQVGTVLGLAMLITVAAAHADTRAGGLEPGAEALVVGHRLAFVLAASIAALGVAAALRLLHEECAARID